MNRGLEFSDLVQEGILGLMVGISKFNWRLGYQFSTYVSWWINQKITRAIQDKARTIRLPVHLAEKYYKIMRATKTLIMDLGREPTHEEIAQRVGMPERFVTKLLQSISRTESESIETPQGPDVDSHTHSDIIADNKSLTPLDALDAKETLDEVTGEVRAFLIRFATLPRLDERFRLMFRMRYGLGGTFFARPTLEVIGDKFGVTRERIRQVIVLCWERLKEGGHHEDEEWLLGKLEQIEELESITGMLTKI